MSDKIGSRKLHLAAVCKCLPLFAAAGHFKSSCLYLQNMSQLEKNHPDAYKKFQLGCHVIQRTKQILAWPWK